MLRHPRSAVALALAALLVTATAACSAPAPAPEPVEITFAFLDIDAAYYEPLAEAFHRSHPNITIKLLPKTWEALSKLGPADGDAFITPYPLHDRLERGDILSLDQWLATDDAFNKSDFYPNTLAQFIREGKTWAIPAGIDIAVMYYNKDLFDARQVAYPQVGWTWEDFLNTALSLRDAASGTYGYAAGAWAEVDPVLFVIEHGGQIVDDWQNPTRITFDDPLTIEAVDWYARLIFEHNVSPTQEEARQAFGGGQYALYAGIESGKIGLWTDMYSVPYKKWEFKWGMTTLPRDRQAANLARVEALAISAQAKHPEACWQWISFLSQQTPARLAPARRSILESQAFEQQAGADVVVVVRASIEHAFLLQDLPALEDLGRLWAKAIDEVLAGKATAAEALIQAQLETEK